MRKYVCRSSQVEKGLADIFKPSRNGYNSAYGCSALHMSLRITNLSPEQWQGAMCNQQGAGAKAVARRIDYDTIPACSRNQRALVPSQMSPFEQPAFVCVPTPV